MSTNAGVDVREIYVDDGVLVVKFGAWRAEMSPWNLGMVPQPKSPNAQRIKVAIGNFYLDGNDHRFRTDLLREIPILRRIVVARDDDYYPDSFEGLVVIQTPLADRLKEVKINY